MEIETKLTFQWGLLDGAEDVHRYGPGGFHPVRLGDVFKSGTKSYHILQKLGNGSFSTVWFASTVHGEAGFP